MTGDSTTPSRRRLSVVIPVFQNAGSLRPTRDAMLGVRETLASRDIDLDLVFVDDGSTDGSWEVLEELRHEGPHFVTAVKLSRNFGQVNAILAGYDIATGDAVATISADLQDPPELLVQMADGWLAGQDVVIAHRSERHDGFLPTAFSRMAYGVARRAHPTMPQGGFDYLLVSRRALDVLRAFPSRHRFFQGDVLWMGFSTTFIPYVRREREHGKSTWTLRKKLKYFTDLLLDSSFAPIQFMSRLGLLTALLGMVYAVVIVFARLANQTPWPGYAPIMITLLILGGMIMVMLGIIGEYLWRIFDEVKGRPLYVVEERHTSQHQRP